MHAPDFKLLFVSLCCSPIECLFASTRRHLSGFLTMCPIIPNAAMSNANPIQEAQLVLRSILASPHSRQQSQLALVAGRPDLVAASSESGRGSNASMHSQQQQQQLHLQFLQQQQILQQQHQQLLQQQQQPQQDGAIVPHRSQAPNRVAMEYALETVSVTSRPRGINSPLTRVSTHSITQYTQDNNPRNSTHLAAEEHTANADNRSIVSFDRHSGKVVARVFVCLFVCFLFCLVLFCLCFYLLRYYFKLIKHPYFIVMIRDMIRRR